MGGCTVFSLRTERWAYALCPVEVVSQEIVLGLLSQLPPHHLQVVCLFATYPSMGESLHFTSVRLLDMTGLRM